ncbi:carboxymuconolactone decarboxylase family protein [Candidatus Laterigemmans baculatus]|uniref:carboxymuconolactone decarboxylase family protein n=1 Tax=Candidatus Laterigemmans baculatus TaxID=2770505 RepID=UPI0013DD1995|nr:carboxymuconolactone decarboxylase family protein [Candidatus Laterigemmans baculatus]
MDHRGSESQWESQEQGKLFERFLEQTFASGTALPKLTKHLIAVAIASLAGNPQVGERHRAEAEAEGATAAAIEEAVSVVATQAGGTQLFWIKEDYEELLGKHWRRKFLPEVDRSFWTYKRAVFADGALEARTKELIAIAVSSALRCRHCTVGYIERALQHGVRQAEIAETLGVLRAVSCESQHPSGSASP